MTNLVNHRGFVAMLCVYAMAAPFAVPVAYGKGAPSLDWDNVLKLHDGSTVIVTLFNNQRYQGRVTGLVTADTLPLKTKPAAMSIPRRDIKTIMTYRPVWANPGLYVGIGGAVLGSAGGLAGTLKDLNTLNGGSLPKGSSGVKLEVAGVIVAVAGIAIYLIAGKPRIIYEGKPAATTNQ